nr:transposase [Frankia sp. Cr1]
MGHLIGDGVVAVSSVADWGSVSWSTAHGGFIRLAEQAGIVVTGPAPTADAEQVDAGETDQAQVAVAGGGELAGEAASDEETLSQLRSVVGPLPEVKVLGIDDQRRGSRRFHTDTTSGHWITDADCWNTVFIDSIGGHGLLGAAEGRANAPVVAWILAQSEAWRAAIQAVTIDMSPVYRSAVRAALPAATLLVDLFQVAQLATNMLDDVRRRHTHRMRGRRRILDTLTALAETDAEAAHEIRVAWKARSLLFELLALAPSRTGLATSRTDVDRALHRFFDYCATFGKDIAELVTLAETIDSWRNEIANAVLLGITNAAAEGVNRLTTLIYRVAFGLRNVANQLRRARSIASRSTRPGWLPRVTTHPHTA